MNAIQDDFEVYEDVLDEESKKEAEHLTVQTTALTREPLGDITLKLYPCISGAKMVDDAADGAKVEKGREQRPLPGGHGLPRAPTRPPVSQDNSSADANSSITASAVKGCLSSSLERPPPSPSKHFRR